MGDKLLHRGGKVSQLNQFIIFDVLVWFTHSKVLGAIEHSLFGASDGIVQLHMITDKWWAS